MAILPPQKTTRQHYPNDFNIMEQLFLTTQNIIQGGGIVIALYLSWILYKITSNHEKHFIEITRDNSDATRENTKVLQELKILIISLKK